MISCTAKLGVPKQSIYSDIGDIMQFVFFHFIV
jgi:hypothetical protein